jgi:8-oxo-dGTP diphosphatase
MSKPFGLAVKAVILDEQGRCLLIRRSDQCENFARQWEWPGGKVDPGEDFVTALVREVREETSLEVEVAGLVGATQYEMATVNVILLHMKVRRVSGQIRLSHEHDDFAWVRPSEFGVRELSDQVRAFMLDYAQEKANKA